MKLLFFALLSTVTGCGLAGADASPSGGGGRSGVGGDSSAGGAPRPSGPAGSGGDASTSSHGATGPSVSASNGSGSMASSSTGASSTQVASSSATGFPACTPGQTCDVCGDCGTCIQCQLTPPGNTCWTTNCTDPTCDAFAACVANCHGDQGCIGICARTYPTAAGQSGQALGCACNACAQCAGQCVGGGNGPPH